MKCPSNTVTVTLVHGGPINIYFGIRIKNLFISELQGSEKLQPRTDISR